MISTVRRWIGGHLWVVGIGAWVMLTWLVAALLPPQPGPDSERPAALALLVGGIVGLPFVAASLIRARRNKALQGLFLWGAIVLLSTWDGLAHTTDGDIDQTVGFGLFWGAAVGIPLIALELRAWLQPRVMAALRRRPRRWHLTAGSSGLVLHRRREEAPDKRTATR